MKHLARTGHRALLALVLLATLAGCGRRGAPVAPSAVPLTTEEKQAGVVREKKKPAKRFILDGLLE